MDSSFTTSKRVELASNIDSSLGSGEAEFAHAPECNFPTESSPLAIYWPICNVLFGICTNDEGAGNLSRKRARKPKLVDSQTDPNVPHPPYFDAEFKRMNTSIQSSSIPQVRYNTVLNRICDLNLNSGANLFPFAATTLTRRYPTQLRSNQDPKVNSMTSSCGFGDRQNYRGVPLLA
ncbi:hypothetical protein R3P38DRAFT_2811872 [Favolaschia claudopus]|uniref:Uncharacterized protein n=1 Tax=Favolaschia claudopus TaxID=2862362 RepID=A0AAV9Z815_9AGAR